MWPAGGDHALQDAQVWQWGSGNGGLALGVFRHARHVCIWDWRHHDGVGGRWDPPPPDVWTRVHYIKIGPHLFRRRHTTKKKVARKNASDRVSKHAINPQFLNIWKLKNKNSVVSLHIFRGGSILPSYTYKSLGGLVGGGCPHA